LCLKMSDCQDIGAYDAVLCFKMSDCQDLGAYDAVLYCVLR